MARPKKQKEDSPSVPMATKPMVSVVLSMSGTEYKSEGATVHEALVNLPLTYMDVKTKGVITVISGDKKCERLFYLRPLKALIANKLRKVGYAKQMEALLK